MKYDFTSIIERSGKDALAVEVSPVEGAELKEGFDKIPMWVADMNFATVPTVTEEMAKRLEHPLFGYYYPREEYYDCIIKWHEKRHGVTGLKKEFIGYENGVVGGVLSAVNALCSRGDKILVHAPAYVGFMHALEDNGYHVVFSDLQLDDHQIWRMDFEDMEKKIREEHIHTVIFCSPHNPTGRVWERWELERAMKIFAKYDVYVIVDEIWSDIVLEDHKHIPLQMISEDAKKRTIAFYSPSKTFNLAGLIGSYHIVYDSYLKDRLLRESSLSHYNNMNVLSMYALLGAYKAEGYEWVDELCQVITQNSKYAYDFIKEHFRGVSVAKAQGTYMLLMDCTKWCEEHGCTLDELLKKGASVGVMWQDGRPFHTTCSIRMNLALPLERVVEAFDRLDKYVFNEK